MRKFTLLLVLLAFTGLTFAQTASLSNTDASPAKVKTLKATKANAPFWTETFDKEDWSATVDQGSTGGYLANGTDLPNGWAVEDLTGNDFVWHWSDVGPRGAYTVIPGDDPLVPTMRYHDDGIWPEGTTLANGCIMLESDYYNTNELGQMVSDPLDMNSHLILGPIDCSDKLGVLVTFNTLYRFCCAGDASFNIEASSDYDPANPTAAHWTKQQIDLLTDGNNFTNALERHVEKNFSDVAAGESAVYIRFSTNGSSHYFIMVDDVSFVEPPVNDLLLADAWAEYMFIIESGPNFWGGYTELPKDAVSNFELFEGVVYNNGTADATNAVLTTKIFKDDALVETLNSTAKDIASNVSDTINIATTFAPTDVASYQISMTVAADATDEVTSNNSWGYEFKTTPYTYSRVRHGMEDRFLDASTRDWQGGGYDGDMLLANYTIDEGTNVLFSGIQVYIDPTTDEGELTKIANGQFQIKARAFSLPFDASSVSEMVDENLSSDLYTLTTADLGTWVYLPFIDEGSSLKGYGDYFVGVECYTGQNPDAADYSKLRIGSDDNGLKQPWGVAVLYQSQDDSQWGTAGANFAIDLMVNMPDMVYLTVNFDMSKAITAETFNPDADDIYLTGSFSGWAEPGTTGSVKANYDAANQIATAKVMIESSATVNTVEFKGFINTGWAGGEWEGEPNHTAKISNSDVTVNVVFGDKDVSVQTSGLQFAKLFPNPFNETLTITNLVDVKEITVSNVLGQRVMSINDVEETVTISSSELENGVFIISIVDNNNNVRTERVVKH